MMIIPTTRQAEECTRFHFREQYQICALNGRFTSAAKQARKRLLSLLELRRFFYCYRKRVETSQ